MEDDKKFELCRNETYFELALRDKNVRSVYNLFKVGLLCVVIENAINDYLYNGGSQYGFKILLKISESFPNILTWLIMIYVLHFLVFFYWRLRIRFKGAKLFFSLGWNHVFAVCVCFQFFGALNLFGVLCIKQNISLLCRFFILPSHTILSMKGYSFLRTNMNHLYEKGKKYEAPTFSHYLYFTIAPTLIYKDVYLRSSRNRSWWRLFGYTFEMFIDVYLIGLLNNMYVSKTLSNFGTERFGFGDVIYYWWKLSLPSFISTVIAHHLLLDGILKFLAELVCFGERQFFTDWWTSTNMVILYKKMNNYIQSYIYVHIYKDIVVYVMPGYKLLAKLIAFGISIILHEILAFYCFEIILFMFLFSMLYSLTQTAYPKTGHYYNFLMLFQYYIGMGFLNTLYHLEYFAKQNCANQPQSLIYYPRLLSCEINN